MNKIKFLLIMILSLIFLSACENISSSQLIDVKDTISIDSNFSGSREFEFKFGTIVQTGFKGGIEEFKKFLEKNVEEPLILTTREETVEITNQNTGESKQEKILYATIKLNFNSFDDYKEKINSLYDKSGIQNKPEISYHKNSNLFKYSLEYIDKSAVDEIFNYLVKEVVKFTYINFTNNVNVFNQINTNLYFDGNLVQENAHRNINYKYQEDLSPLEIVFLISNGKDGKYNKTATMIFNTTSSEKLSSEWTNHLMGDLDLKVEGPINIKKDGVDLVAYRFNYEDKNIDEIEMFSGKILFSKSIIDIKNYANIDTMTYDYEVSEKLIKESEDISTKKIYSIYTNKKIDIKDHVFNIIENIDKSKYDVVFENKELLEGAKKIKTTNANLGEINIFTKISKGDIKRKITFGGNINKDEKILQTFIIPFLEKNNVDYQKENDEISLEYSIDENDKTNSVFFDSKPNYEYEKIGFTQYNIKFLENSKLLIPNLKINKSEFEIPFLSSIENLDKKSTEKRPTNMYSNFVVKGFNPNSVAILVLIIIFVIIIMIIFIRFIYKRYAKKINIKIDDTASLDYTLEELDEELKKTND